MFVDAAAVEFESAKQPRIYEFFQGAINRWPTDVIFAAFSRQLIDELVGVKMLMATENLLHQETALLGFPKATADQVLFKSLDRSLCNFDSF